MLFLFSFEHGRRSPFLKLDKISLFPLRRHFVRLSQFHEKWVKHLHGCLDISTFNASAGMSSGPAALPFSSCMIAFQISSSIGTVQTIGRLWLAGWMSTGSSGAGLLRSFPKYSAHLFLCHSLAIEAILSFICLSIVVHHSESLMPHDFFIPVSSLRIVALRSPIIIEMSLSV